MRLIKALFGLAFIVLGLVFAALNRDVVAIDLGLMRAHASLGVLILLVLLAGVLLGGVVALSGLVWPRRRSGAGSAAGRDG